MADDYGTCPNDVFVDERLEGAPLHIVSGFSLVMLTTDDYGLFDGNPAAFARRYGGTPEQVAELWGELEQRRLVAFYEVAGRGGVNRRVGEVVDFLSYQGHPKRVAFDTKRGASAYPMRDGSMAPSRRARSQQNNPTPKPTKTSVAGSRQKRGTNVAQPGQSSGTDAAEVRHNRGSQRSVAERSVAVAPLGATAEPAAPGAAQHADSVPAAPQVSALGAPPPAQHAGQEPPLDVALPESEAQPGGKLVDFAEARETRTEALAKTRGPPPRRSDFSSVAGYEAARQAWLGDAGATA